MYEVESKIKTTSSQFEHLNYDNKQISDKLEKQKILNKELQTMVEEERILCQKEIHRLEEHV